MHVFVAACVGVNNSRKCGRDNWWLVWGLGLSKGERGALRPDDYVVWGLGLSKWERGACDDCGY